MLGTREINVGVEDIISTPVVNPNPPASKDSVQEQDANARTSINIETTEHGSEQRATELYFEALYNKPGKHAFYCPNCKACIDKVLLQSTEDELITRSRERDDNELRCPSCFEFFKPIGTFSDILDFLYKLYLHLFMLAVLFGNDMTLQ